MRREPLTREAMFPPAYPEPERPVGEIVTQLWSNTERLVLDEMALARVELDKRVDQAKTDCIRGAASGAALLVGFVTLVGAAILLLDRVLDTWLAALLVGLAVSIAGYALRPKGKAKRLNQAHQARPLLERRTYAVKEVAS